MRRIDLIVIHHTASPRDTTAIEQIMEWHAEKFGAGFDGYIGYHYVILGDGTRVKTRDNWIVGMHTFGSNINSIGIALTGNFETEVPSAKQMEALKSLIEDLRKAYGNLKAIGHKDSWWSKVRPTLCPGQNLYEEIVKGV